MRSRPESSVALGSSAGVCHTAAVSKEGEPQLLRRMGLLALVATGMCSMIGAAINVIPLMIQRDVPGIGPNVLPAYLLGAIPAVLAALAYAALSSAMPSAGGGYVLASRSLHPYLGFISSFSQWLGLSVAMGVVSYLLVPFLRDIASTVGMPALASALDHGPTRAALALAFIWVFAAVNILGLDVYERTLVPLFWLMFISGAVVIPAGFIFDHADFNAALVSQGAAPAPSGQAGSLNWTSLGAAAAILFSTLIGFDSIAQAGGEARNPRRNLPLSILICLGAVTAYYLLFTAAVYHAVPWTYVSQQALEMGRDLTAPGLLGHLLSPGWTVLIVAGAAIALINDLPAMLLAVSRLVFAWSRDGVFPSWTSAVSRRYQTPYAAVLLSAAAASASVIGCYFADDFFRGVDVLVTSMLINYLVISLSLLWVALRRPQLSGQLGFLKSRRAQILVGAAGVAALGILLAGHTWKDLTAERAAWHYRSTYLWLLTAAAATIVFAAYRRRRLRQPD